MIERLKKKQTFLVFVFPLYYFHTTKAYINASVLLHYHPTELVL